jgi:hypothetical protein
MVPDYFSDKPVERLIGAGIKAEHINDDALGRLLDKLYELGVSELYQGLFEKVVSHLGLPCDLVLQVSMLMGSMLLIWMQKEFASQKDIAAIIVPI